MRLVEPRRLPLLVRVSLTFLAAVGSPLLRRYDPLQHFRTPHQRLGAWALLPGLPALVLVLLAPMELSSLGFKPERLVEVRVVQLPFVVRLPLLAIVGNTLPCVPAGYYVHVAVTPLQSVVALAGQFLLLGRPPHPREEWVLKCAHPVLPRTPACCLSVEWLPGVVLLPLLRCLPHRIAVRPRWNPFRRRSWVFVRPRLTRRLPLVDVHGQEIPEQHRP